MIINVKLLNEGSEVYLPMNAKAIDLDLYEIEYTNYDKTDVFPEFIKDAEDLITHRFFRITR